MCTTLRVPSRAGLVALSLVALVLLSGATLTPPGGVSEEAKHVPKFSGELFYVTTSGNDANTCTAIHAPCLTIGAAIGKASAGDAIAIKAGTYTEVGIDVSLASLELWFEIGAVIDPASGTALTVSGGSNRIRGPVLITPAAGATGVHVTAGGAELTDVRVSGGATGFDVDATGNTLTRCRVSTPTSIAFDLGAGGQRLESCATVGSGGATTGYYINAGSDYGLLLDCTSAGHGTAGFTIDAGSSGWTLADCSSGAGDGRWTDADGVNVWSGFGYDDEVLHEVDFDGSGPTSENLYRIYGAVRIYGLHADVTTALSADVGNGYVELYDGTISPDVTDAPGPSFNSLVAGTLVHKADTANENIEITEADQARIYEDTDKFGSQPVFTIVAKEGVATYLRFVYSGTGTSGSLHWHARWEPIDDDGFVDSE